jgi:transposase
LRYLNFTEIFFCSTLLQSNLYRIFHCIYQGRDLLGQFQKNLDMKVGSAIIFQKMDLDSSQNKTNEEKPHLFAISSRNSTPVSILRMCNSDSHFKNVSLQVVKCFVCCYIGLLIQQNSYDSQSPYLI